MTMQTLSAEVRTEGGKGPSRQLRFRGLIPAVYYGPSIEAQKLAVAPKELIKALSTVHGRNVVIELGLGSGKALAMVREVQVHPVSRDPLHVDFYAVALDRTVDVKVPFRPEGKAVGVQKGGAINMIFKTLPIRTTPDKIPAEIIADVTPLDIGEALMVKDVKLPPGVEMLLKPERRLATCDEYSKLVMAEEPTDAASAEAGATAAAGAAPAAAAPAADKKPAEKK